MKEALRQRARELGFDDCRFTTASPPESAPHLQRWLAERKHGEMAYLERNAQKRVEPQQVLPGARSILSLSVSYAQPGSRPSLDEVEPHPTNSSSTPSGTIARYARYDDYHRVMGERLK